MPKTPIKILAINPGTKYLGIAFFNNSDLRDWAIKVIPGKWSKSKLIKIQTVITELISRYQPDVIVLKSLDPSRRSSNLNKLVCEIRAIAMRKGIAIHEYALEDLKRFYSPDKRINKRCLAEIVAAEYPALFYELSRGISHKNDDKAKEKDKKQNQYVSRLFEAVASGAVSAST